MSLPDEDVEFLDTYAATSGMTSRSAVLHKAVRLLKAQELSNDYESAWDEWSESDDEQRWDNALADGLDP